MVKAQQHKEASRSQFPTLTPKGALACDDGGGGHRPSRCFGPGSRGGEHVNIPSGGVGDGTGIEPGSGRGRGRRMGPGRSAVIAPEGARSFPAGPAASNQHGAATTSADVPGVARTPNAPTSPRAPIGQVAGRDKSGRARQKEVLRLTKLPVNQINQCF